ncbi:hypothetical protein [Bacillus benzoevorans]|uniref:Uncharacterized protein n=1 Tax=Bacillus benzoevorans TaxID=1456 RepID=A0A7X0LVK3_9BACI|nr:hypothetical protein [Bacillus benzoevorans]MBB6446096.1 hypothetical protein [Bacillus benzoevorans]
MKLKGMIIGGTALVLLISASGYFFYEMNKTDNGASVARVQQPEADKEREEKGDNRDSNMENSDQKNAADTEGQADTTGVQNPETPVDNINEETGTTGENSAPTAPETSGNIGETPAAAPNNKQTGGLYFATREEAVAFGFSRFTQEEIDLYNRASAKGLTPEQQELAIQMAYSRFTAEEIAAIEEALNR